MLRLASHTQPFRPLPLSSAVSHLPSVAPGVSRTLLSAPFPASANARAFPWPPVLPLTLPRLSRSASAPPLSASSKPAALSARLPAPAAASAPSSSAEAHWFAPPYLRPWFLPSSLPLSRLAAGPAAGPALPLLRRASANTASARVSSRSSHIGSRATQTGTMPAIQRRAFPSVRAVQAKPSAVLPLLSESRLGRALGGFASESALPLLRRQGMAAPGRTGRQTALSVAAAPPQRLLTPRLIPPLAIQRKMTPASAHAPAFASASAAPVFGKPLLRTARRIEATQSTSHSNSQAIAAGAQASDTPGLVLTQTARRAAAPKPAFGRSLTTNIFRKTGESSAAVQSAAPFSLLLPRTGAGLPQSTGGTLETRAQIGAVRQGRRPAAEAARAAERPVPAARMLSRPPQNQPPLGFSKLQSFAKLQGFFGQGVLRRSLRPAALTTVQPGRGLVLRAGTTGPMLWQGHRPAALETGRAVQPFQAALPRVKLPRKQEGFSVPGTVPPFFPASPMTGTGGSPGTLLPRPALTLTKRRSVFSSEFSSDGGAALQRQASGDPLPDAGYSPALPTASRTATSGEPGLQIIQRKSDAANAEAAGSPNADTGKAGTPEAGQDVNLLAHEVWSLLKARIGYEAERMGRR